MTLFKEVDDIVGLGKWAYDRIPEGERCHQCPILGQVGSHWFCGLRRTIRLLCDRDSPLKDIMCPKGAVKK